MPNNKFLRVSNNNLMNFSNDIGLAMHLLGRELWPLNRSITGDGVRKTLNILGKYLPNLKVESVPTGTRCFDWVVPKEWRVTEAWIKDPEGNKCIDFKNNNLHLVSYSVPVKASFTLVDLQKYLYSLPEQPDAIPYVTSYYAERWGFCLTHNQREKLIDGEYQVLIKSELVSGVLNYGELTIPSTEGNSEEVLLSTYICHPSMANNELSGPLVTTALCQWIMGLKKRRYNYRIVFVPETIGSIIFLSKNLKELKDKVVAGFNITCVGDDRSYSYLPTRNGKTLSDQVAKHILKWIDSNYKTYDWAERGSDERQYCAPGVDLPVASIMRTKYGEYPEYHTSLDDFESVVTPKGLEGGYEALRRAIEALERNCYPNVTVLGEPQLGKRGLYPTLSTRNSHAQVGRMMNLLTWSDGTNNIIDIAEKCCCPVWELYPLIDKLNNNGILKV